MFDKVFLNTGIGYNQSNGVFTAPRSGVYAFYFYALSHGGKSIYSDLYHNAHYVDSLYGYSDGEYAAGGNAATLELLSGDTVYVSVRDTGALYYGTPSEIYCTFSGYFVGDVLKINPGPIIG